MKTRITAVLLATLLLFSFAACGKTATDATTAATTAMQTTVQAGGTIAAETTTIPDSTQSNTDSRTGAATTAATTKATTQAATTTVPAAKTFTAAQLAEFNGKDDKAAYLAYDGTVYDVSNVKVWKSGSHFGLVVGTDVTEQVKACNKHLITFMEAQFSTYPKVGNYIG